MHLTSLPPAMQGDGCFIRCSIGGLYWDQQPVPIMTTKQKTVASLEPSRQRSKSSDENCDHRQLQPRSLKASRSKSSLKRQKQKQHAADSQESVSLDLAFYVDTSKLLEAEESFVDAFTVHVQLFRASTTATRQVVCLGSAQLFMAPLVDQAVRSAASNQPPCASGKRTKLAFAAPGAELGMFCHAIATFCFVRLAPCAMTGMDSGCALPAEAGRQLSTIELAMKRLFYAIDTDGNGSISLSELAAAVQHRRLPRPHSSTVRLQTTDLDLLMGQLLVSHSDTPQVRRFDGASSLSPATIQELFDKIVCGHGKCWCLSHHL